MRIIAMKTYIIIFSSLFSLLFFWGYSFANVIILKNGEMIATQGVWEENGCIKYFKDGKISPCIPKDQIKLVITDSKVLFLSFWYSNFEFVSSFVLSISVLLNPVSSG